ncbi:bacterial transcriptional activator domain-containing protein [Streptomyces sp. NPDC006251]|uniref:bacterial transcriptional activator domain-containing protein n=1 Tax=Streptomyces sp. NPDC006251 TaxID=3155718 RepID=UPI0033A3F27C
MPHLPDPSNHRLPHLPGGPANSRQTALIRNLISRAQSLTADSPTYDLARWRATALVVLSAICPPGDLVWKLLRPDTDYSAALSPHNDQAFAEGWGTTLGVLEGLVAHLPPDHQDEPLGSPKRTLTPPPGPALYRPALRKDADPLQDLLTTGPVIRLLGPADILGTDGPHPGGPDLRRIVEAAAFIHLRPGGDPGRLDRALWPRHPINTRTRDHLTRQLRNWVGADRFPERPEGGYAFTDKVTSDWTHFQQRVRTAQSAPGPYGDQALRQALDMVQGAPCTDLSPDDPGGWAAPYAHAMTILVVDAARQLMERRLAAGDLTGAAWAGGRAMLVAPAPEAFHLSIRLSRLTAGEPGAGQTASAALETLRATLDAARPVGIQAAHAPEPSSPPAGTATPPSHAAPFVRYFGAVELVGATGPVGSNRRRRLTEYAAYLHLHPGCRYQDLDRALWPEKDIRSTTRNAATSHLRKWIGAEYFPDASPDGGYAFTEAVSSDWSLFQAHLQTARNASAAEGEAALERALELVRGRPFAGTSPGGFKWAERLAHDMSRAIIDAAYDLVHRRLEAGDVDGALWAAGQGLLATPPTEYDRVESFRADAPTDRTSAAHQAAEDLRNLKDTLVTAPSLVALGYPLLPEAASA